MLYFFTFCGISATKAGEQNEYSVTPPFPPVGIYTTERNRLCKLLILLLLLFSQRINGQVIEIDSLPKIEELGITLGDFHRREASYQIEQYTYQERWKWLKYMPSFGWNFITNAPYAGYNTTDLFNTLNLSRQKRAYIESIIHKTNLDFQKSAIQLKLKYDLYHSKLDLFNQKLVLLELAKKYLQIQEDLYRKKELTPSQYLTDQISYEGKFLEIMSLKSDMRQLRNEILELSFFGDKEILIKSLEDVSTD